MTLMNKYVWVVNQLYRAGGRGLSLRELNEEWLKSDWSLGEPIPRQTFDRWKAGIVDTLGIVIECHLKGGYRYYIYNPSVLDYGEVSRWLLDTYTTANALSQNTALKDRIMVEEVPSSREHLTEIMEAMKENRVIRLTHKGFKSEKSHTYPVEPYCLRMFQKRWYLLARSPWDGRLRLYALDRVEAVEISDGSFTLPEDFDAKAYFSTFFGIVLHEDKSVERIVIRANKDHSQYLRTLPLHPSQKEIATAGNHSDFEYHLRPTYDFCMELLRAGNFVEVLEPQSLRHDMHLWTRDLYNLYKND